MAKVRGFLSYQIADFSGVRPEHRWSQKERAFYLNSPAGLLRYKPKSERDLERFRNKYINRFDQIISQPDSPRRSREIFKLYAEIRGAEKVRYQANINTRIKVALCSLNPFL